MRRLWAHLFIGVHGCRPSATAMARSRCPTPHRPRPAHRLPPAFRPLAALSVSAALVFGCASPGPTARPAVSPGAAATAGPSATPLVVGGAGQSPVPAAVPAPVDFEAGGDESNGWWWLRDSGGAQQASWGFADLPASGPIELEFAMLADAANAAGGASFWLSYGAIDQAGVNPDGPAPTLVALKDASSAGEGNAAMATGAYTIGRSGSLAGATGLWVRVARSGPDGSTLPGSLAVQASSVRLAGSPGATEAPPAAAAPAPPSPDFSVDGDQISGWWWLRDGAGRQRASWTFLGLPTGDQLRIDMNLLATDTINGGREIDAQFWLTYRTMLAGGGNGPLSTPRLITLKNISPPDDPVGYDTSGSVFLPAAEIASNATGLWIGMTRVGPDGSVLSTHIAVRAASVQVSGLGGPAKSPAPTSGPNSTPSPTASPYGPLTITSDCQQSSNAPMVVTGSAAPDLRLEFSPTESFSAVYTNDIFALSPPSYTYQSVYSTLAFPNGIWVRWAGAHSIKAHATNKGYCAGWSPQPTATPAPTPSPTWAPPSGLPTVVSLGDSYISGEAGRWAGNSYDWYYWTDAGGANAYDQPADGTQTTAGCHRSKAAEVHFDEGGYGHVLSVNLACSGATTQTRSTGDGDKPGIDNCPNDIHRPDNDPLKKCPTGIKGQGTLLTEVAGTHNVALVVLSIGGNDFEFAKTVVQCSTDFFGSSYWYDTDHCYDDGSVMARFTTDSIYNVRVKLVNAYEDVVLAMRAAQYPDDHWSLLIQNYPSPLPRGNDIRYTQMGYTRFNNGCPFWNEDANWANDTALPTISNTINAAVAQFSQNYPGIDVHVMDVSQALNGHRLCENGVGQVGPTQDVHSWTSNGASGKSEWVAQIRGIFSAGGMASLPGLVYFKNESFHPNYWGQLALRNCLRQAWNNGAVRGGTCEYLQNGLGSFGEPQMILRQP